MEYEKKSHILMSLTEQIFHSKLIYSHVLKSSHATM